MRGGSWAAAVLACMLLCAAFAGGAGWKERANKEHQKDNGTLTGWSDEFDLSNDNWNEDEYAMALNNNSLNIVWSSSNPSSSNMFFLKSVDEGRTWSPRHTLASSSTLIIEPNIASFNNSTHAVWCDYTGGKGIYYRNSFDGGNTWNPAKKMSLNGVAAGNPHVFVNHTNVHILWHDFRVGVNGQVFYRRSLDGGNTFDNGQGVDTDRQITFSPSTIGSVDIAGDGSNISVIWWDERSGWELYWMISKDNGYTWEDGLGHINQDRRLTVSNKEFQHDIVVNGSNIYIVYTTENWPGPTYKIYYLLSTDNGATWQPPLLLSGPNAASFAPNIAVLNNDVWISWNDNRDGSFEIFYKNSTDGGNTWGVDTRLTDMDGHDSGGPIIILTGNVKHVIWQDTKTGYTDLYYKRFPDLPCHFTYNIPVVLGWNLISIPLNVAVGVLPSPLLDKNGDTLWDRVMCYYSYQPSNRWGLFNTGWASVWNDLRYVNSTMGSWINITTVGDGFLNVSGYLANSTSIPLRTGWNLVGYPTLATNMTVANAFWGTGADQVEAFDPGATYKTKVVGPGYVMKPGEGYWVHVVADSVWTVDW